MGRLSRTAAGADHQADINVLPAYRLMTMNGDQIATRLQGGNGCVRDFDLHVIRGVSVKDGGHHPVDKNFSILVVVNHQRQTALRCHPDGELAQNQISGVFQFVPTTAAGVPFVPKPPRPCFHLESLEVALT